MADLGGGGGGGGPAGGAPGVWEKIKKLSRSPGLCVKIKDLFFRGPFSKQNFAAWLKLLNI